jgi:hypothetical protein
MGHGKLTSIAQSVAASNSLSHPMGRGRLGRFCAENQTTYRLRWADPGILDSGMSNPLISSLKISALFLILSFPRVAVHAAENKIIEFGWDEPNPAFMRAHIAEMEKTPFDGCVFHVEYAKTNGGGAGSFTWEGWGTRAFTMEELRPALNDLKATSFRRFKHNFLRFNTSPAKLDWFDDFSAILTNAELAALVAREGRCAGILFDTEEYEGPLFNYHKQRDASKKSWEQYAAQARLRGREVMTAFQKGFPGLRVFLTFAYSLPSMQCAGNMTKLPDVEYGLLAPFMDGLFEGAKGKTKIVDGFEPSYAYKTPADFKEGRKIMTERVLPLVADRERYEKYRSLGFGIWMDEDWRKYGWNTEDFSKNYFTPDTFQASVRLALASTDEYIWIYTETPRWWGKAGAAEKLPSAYDAALRHARSNQVR